MNILRDIDHIHETIIGFHEKGYPGIKEVLLEIKNMKEKFIKIWQVYSMIVSFLKLQQKI